MPTATRTFPNLYRDSVALMQLSAKLAARSGIAQAYTVMATPANLELLAAAGLAVHEAQVSPNDVLVVVQGEIEEELAVALDVAADYLMPAHAASGDAAPQSQLWLRSIQMGLEALPTANLALISTPGEFAAAEAYKALRLGLNVMIFSDNVTVEDEVALKRLAQAAGLLVMGPDCGTAIVNGIPLAFANVVRAGRIGVVGASGTGIQQITSLVDRMGAGISHALGTGGRDLHSAVGGISMLTALADLAADAATEVIVLVSKPPAPEVATRILDAAAQLDKPVVVNFLGASLGPLRRPLYAATTLAEAARMAVALSLGKSPTQMSDQLAPKFEATLATIAAQFSPSQRHVRGLFSGGTFCYEALLLLEQSGAQVYSNLAHDSARRLTAEDRSRGHTLIDLGDDDFTRGRPHPMIDQRLRSERILSEAADPATAILLLDFVLGYGAHQDPAAALAPVIVQAKADAARAGRQLAVIAFVCGTAGDPQQLARQEALLAEAGVVLAESSTEAVRLVEALLARLPVSAGRN